MKRSITRWTTAFAAAAFFGLPATGIAQTPPTQPPVTASSPAPMSQDTAAVQSPAEHLTKAKAALEGIPATGVTGRAKTQIAELKRHLSALERASAAKSAVPARPNDARSNANWGTEVAAMDKILTELLGTATTTGAGIPATTGTTGAATASKPAAKILIDEATRTQLTEVRTHLTAYATAMSGAAVKTPDAAVETPATQPTTATPPMTTLPATAPPAAQPPATGQPPVTGQPPAMTQPPATPSTTPPAEASAATVDQEAARRDLIAARDTLNQLTQLPAAAQLTGDARTQVTQLIANFNELITTESDWPASYAKVSANMTALLGPEEASGEATTATPPVTGTTGAVGTSGTAAVTLDPAIRTKLIEMRKQLSAFEKASGVIKK